jgi:hypothetical protein
MSESVTGRSFAVAVRVKERNRGTSAIFSAEPALQLPRLRPSEIAAAAGFAAVRRALEQMQVEEGPTA